MWRCFRLFNISGETTLQSWLQWKWKKRGEGWSLVKKIVLLCHSELWVHFCPHLIFPPLWLLWLQRVALLNFPLSLSRTSWKITTSITPMSNPSSPTIRSLFTLYALICLLPLHVTIFDLQPSSLWTQAAPASQPTLTSEADLGTVTISSNISRFTVARADIA